MSTFYDQFQRCFRHPQQPIMGVCPNCLQERLFLLIESISSRDATSRRCNLQQVSSLQEPAVRPDHTSNGCVHKITVMHERESSLTPLEGNLHKNGHGNAHGLGRTGPAPQEQMPTMRTHLAKHAHRSSDVTELLVMSSDECHGRQKAAMVTSSGHGKKRGSTTGTELEKLASPHENIREPHDRGGKKKSSWFSLPKSKNSAHVDNRKLSWKHGRSSAWILSFLQRRKWPQSDTNLANSRRSSVTDATMDTTSTGAAIPNGAQHVSSPKNSNNAGRLSAWDAVRPNFKQLLKRIEAHSTKHRRADDRSPSPYNNYTYRENSHEGPSLQKSKTVTSSRASSCVEVQNKRMQTSPSPIFENGHGNGTVGVEYLTRSRSWSRTWNRVLSPLRSYRSKDVYEYSPSSAYQYSHYHQVGSLTPSHVSFIQPSVCAPTPCSSHLSPSPLRRSSLAPEEQSIETQPF